MFGKRMVHIVHEIIEDNTSPGGVFLDATVGNGFDTEFLCRLAGPGGRVYGFDIQQTAIDHTTNFLKTHHIEDRALLFCASHHMIKEKIEEPIDAFVFNLGYLPGSDEQVITRAETTVEAVRAALDLLKKNGVGTVLCYYGHPDGVTEYTAVNDFLESLPTKRYEIFKIQSHNRSNFPPVLYAIKKH